MLTYELLEWLISAIPAIGHSAQQSSVDASQAQSTSWYSPCSVQSTTARLVGTAQTNRAIPVAKPPRFGLQPGDRLRVGWEGYRESRRCSRDTYPESYITKYTSIRRQTLPGLVSSQVRKSCFSRAVARPCCVEAEPALFGQRFA